MKIMDRYNYDVFSCRTSVSTKINHNKSTKQSYHINGLNRVVHLLIFFIKLTEPLSSSTDNLLTILIFRFHNKSISYNLYVLVECGSNYDSLFARTVAFPVQVAYWTKEVIAPCGYSVPCQF